LTIYTPKNIVFTDFQVESHRILNSINDFSEA
jgi:hypothetical protein